MSDLNKYCVHLLGKEGMGPVKGSFPISNYVVCDGSRGGYIIQQW